MICPSFLTCGKDKFSNIKVIFYWEKYSIKKCLDFILNFIIKNMNKKLNIIKMTINLHIFKLFNFYKKKRF